MGTRWEQQVERAGIIEGAVLAPFFGIGSLLRQARFFHPEGLCFHAEVRPTQGASRFAGIAERLTGPALVRLSTAWWRGGREWPDVLGCAVRFEPATERSEAQDLLFATIPRPWLTPFAPLWTHQHDFLANLYYAVSPFELAGEGEDRFRIRLVPEQTLGLPAWFAGVSAGTGLHQGKSRRARLEEAVSEGRADLHLQVTQDKLDAPWLPVVSLRLLRAAEVDQTALRFSPFRTGRGIKPRGYVHSLRRPVYALSQALRPSGSPR